MGIVYELDLVNSRSQKKYMKTKDLLELSKEKAIEYLEGVDLQSVAPSERALANMERFEEPLPETTSDPKETIELLHEYGSPATVASAGGRYFGFVIGGALPISVGASWIANAWDQCAGVQVLSPIGAKLEEVASSWMLDLLDLDRKSAVGFVTGATMANFSGLAAARHALLKKKGWQVETQGLYGAPEINVVVGEEVHVSVEKALSLLGLGSERVTTVPVDEQGRMLADRLPEMDAMTIVCAQIGNVNSGASDPVKKICELAHKSGAWVHVDGAFGLWARASADHEHLVEGIEAADSIATDLHKWLNVPYDSGVVFCRHSEELRGSMTINAAYIEQDESRQPYFYTPGMSRRARGIEAWASLRYLGRSGLQDLVVRCCRYTKMFEQRLLEAGHEILNNVELNQLVVSFGSDEKTEDIITTLQKEGTLWAGGTKWRGKSGMRISVSSWATSEEDVERSISKILEVAEVFQD